MKKVYLIVIVLFIFILNLFCSDWEVKNYVDDFGDYTGRQYLEFSSWGVFSNLVTYGDKLYVKVIVDSDIAVIRMFEYGLFPCYTYENGFSTIKIKYMDSIIEEIRVFIGSENIYIKEDYDKFINILNNDSEIKIFFEKDDSRYNFSLRSNQFYVKYGLITKTIGN